MSEEERPVPEPCAQSEASEDSQPWWNWQNLGVTEAAAMWRDLSAWVGWLRGRYPTGWWLPGCWYRHSELVEELTAAWVAWLAAYTDPEAKPTAGLAWHSDMSLLAGRASSLYRLDRCIGKTSHHESEFSPYEASAVDDDEAFREHVKADLAGRKRPGTNPDKDETY